MLPPEGGVCCFTLFTRVFWGSHMGNLYPGKAPSSDEPGLHTQLSGQVTHPVWLMAHTAVLVALPLVPICVSSSSGPTGAHGESRGHQYRLASSQLSAQLTPQLRALRRARRAARVRLQTPSGCRN